MNKKQIKQLILESYKNDTLDPERVDEIVNILDRKELKEYIKVLKNWENKKSVVITMPYPPKNEDKYKFLTLFPDKKIVYNIDPSLLVGVKIKNDDLITEINLKDTLRNIVDYISQTYD